MKALRAILLLSLAASTAIAGPPVYPNGGVPSASTVSGVTIGAHAPGTLHNDGSGNLMWNKSGQFLSGADTKSADFTISEISTSGGIYYVTTGSSTITATLPAAATSGAGWFVMLEKADTGTGHVATSPSTISLTNKDVTLLVWSDGTAYHSAVMQPNDLTNSGTFSHPNVSDELDFTGLTNTLRFNHLSGGLDVQDDQGTPSTYMHFSGVVSVGSGHDFSTSGNNLWLDSGNSVGFSLYSGTGASLNGPFIIYAQPLYFDTTAYFQSDGSGNLGLTASSLTLNVSNQISVNSSSYPMTMGGRGFAMYDSGGSSGGTLYMDGGVLELDPYSWLQGDGFGSIDMSGNVSVSGGVTAYTLAGDGYSIYDLNADNITNGTLSDAHGGTGKNSFVVGTDYISPAYFWPGATSVSKTANSIVTSGGSGHYAFFRLSAWSAHATAAADQTSPVLNYNSSVGLITVMQGIGSQFYSAIIDANAAQGVANTLPNGGSSPLVYFPGALYIVVSGSLTVSAGDVLTDAHGASGIVNVNHTGTDPGFQWVTGTKWFTLGDTLVKNGTSTGLTITDTGPLPSGENNRQILFRGRHLVSDPIVWCIWNDTATNSSGATIEVKQ